MGVPKFFRYISERYPCLSELVKDYQIPEFDNLYLDMNGIIHMCSHPNDFDPHFRITEERIFKDIFHYLEILFQMIKPRKLFFMAVDGVAPRAKMNQQRGRRFRSAKEAEVLEKKAEAKGEKLPSEARFDSNCITPGTVFMARLHEQLKYFVTSKISSDEQWKGVKVILSGHETPGEGEHKIMEYIRWMKTQKGYDPNTRHCLYGLDADLMMLGLCTHEPHFSLLREEVKFGKQSKRTSVPEETKFYLLHLSLMREYLDLEFQALRGKLNFPYDLESIIDDWVLMGFLVGNDFIPHLPDVHIASGALPMLYNAYIEVLPSLDGYINEKGFLKLDRFQKFMEKLSAFDINQFKETYADTKYFESKTNRKMGDGSHSHQNGKGTENGIKQGNAELDALIRATNEMVLEKFFDEDDGDIGLAEEDEDDVDVFGSRVYEDDSDPDVSDTFLLEFHQHKKDYYRNKLDYGKVTEKVLKDQAEGYVRAIQWNLHYYYHGVASWSWYYPHHYAPYVSDICNFKDVSLNFDLGDPFKPFEQLLAVLPAASKTLLPEPYRKLMVQESSPIIEYYPPDFQTDLNGKKQDWEAVVLIPFIDENHLLSAMVPCQELLADEERKRNKFGPMLTYCFSEENLGEYKAPEYFPTIKVNHAKCLEVWREDLHLKPQEIIHGLLPGVRLDVYFPGFPTFAHLPYSGELKKAKVKVFDQASRGDNMILTLLNTKSMSLVTLKEAADKFIGKDVYCGWPHLSEAKVVAVADGTKRYNRLGSGEVVLENLQNTLAAQCKAVKNAVATQYMQRQGVDIGEVNIIAYVQHVAGRKYVFGASGKITLEKIYSEIQDPYAIQTIVEDITVHDPSFVQYRTLDQVFPQGSSCFLLASPVYGSLGKVLEVKTNPEGRLMIKMATNGEPNVDYIRANHHALKPLYMPGNKAAQHLGISPHILSRITGTVYLIVGNKQADNPSKINIGLNLKFNKKNEEVPGFTRKENNMWLYSRKAIALLREYIENFPEIFDHLSQQTSNDVYDDKDIYPGDDCSERVAVLSKWLKEIPSASVDRQSCGAEILDEEVVAQIQVVVKAYIENPPEYKRLKLQVKPHTVYKAELRIGNLAPDPSTTYQLFDRVVNVRDDSSVPLGLRGTLIGIHRSENAADTMFDVLFDQEFPSGMSLYGSKACSYRVSRTALINISHGHRQGLIHESYWNCQSDSKLNSAFASLSGQAKPGNQQGNQWKPLFPHKNRTNEQSTNKRHTDPSNKSNRFKFPAPPNVQNLPKEVLTSAVNSKEHQLWNQLQMVSGKNVNPKAHPPPPSSLPLPDETITNVIDTKTNVLKLMLGVKPLSVGEAEKVAATSLSPSSSGVNVNSNQLKNQGCLIKKNSQDACGLLMDFFQRKGTGVPTYSVLPLGADVYVEVRLPDGSVIRGKEAPTKQEAAEHAAIDALHYLQFCCVCERKNVNIQQHPQSSAQSQTQTRGQVSGQPQQFFQQFRQGRFPPPPRPPMCSGNTGWLQSGSNRQTLTRAPFPQGPPPFPPFQVPHPSSYQQAQSLPTKFSSSQQPQASFIHKQQFSPQKKQMQHFSNQQRGEDFESSKKRFSKHQPQQQLRQTNQQKSSLNDSSSFVPLQAMKKQRNSQKSASLLRQEHQEMKSAIQAPQEMKVEKSLGGTQIERNSPKASTQITENSRKKAPESDEGMHRQNKEKESSSSGSVSRMRKSRLAINFTSMPNQ